MFWPFEDYMCVCVCVCVGVYVCACACVCACMLSDLSISGANLMLVAQ